jgi:biotin-(acetyl-CoA carboxylase) ligase
LSKYRAKKTVIDGMTFDSKLEAKRYQELKLMERSGLIKDLKTQVEYELIPKQNVDGHKERATKYKADFQYIDKDGNIVVEDSKSKVTQTPEYVIKRKLMLWLHGIKIKEIFT